MSLKKTALIGLATATLGIGFWASQAFYTVKEVIDGDTFITTENQYIRFDKVDAPEINNCLGSEAKQELSNLILGNKVFLKISYIEKDRNRLVASVYSEKGNVEAEMLKKGLATLRGGAKQDDLNNASNLARNSKIGVYSDKCTQTVNKVNPKCVIKGNNRNGDMYYRYPTCDQYQTTLVQLHFGDKWFCTEAEALKAGFTKGSDCKK